MNRLSRKLFSLLAIGALLFAQLAVAAYACPMQFAGADEAASMDAACEKNASQRDADSPALCQQHCENGPQNVNDSPQVPVFFAVETGRVVAPSMATMLPIRTSATPAFLSHATSPPHTIRNCCFRI